MLVCVGLSLRFPWGCVYSLEGAAVWVKPRHIPRGAEGPATAGQPAAASPSRHQVLPFN